jgi:tRNA splicing endonuclease
MVVILRERSEKRVILRERSDRRIWGRGVQPDRRTPLPEILRALRALRMTRKKGVIARSEATKQ